MSKYIRTKDDIYEAYREIEVKPLSNSLSCCSTFPNESGYFAKTRNGLNIFIPKKDVIRIKERFYEELCDCFVLKYVDNENKEHIKVFDTYKEKDDFIDNNKEQIYSFTTYGAIYADTCIKYVIQIQKDFSTSYEIIKDKID